MKKKVKSGATTIGSFENEAKKMPLVVNHFAQILSNELQLQTARFAREKMSESFFIIIQFLKM